MMELPEVGDAISKSRIDVNLYLSSAKRFADTSIESFELVTRLVTPEKGLYARLDHLLVDLKTAFKETPELYYEMASFAQQYQITHERFLMQSAFNVAFKLRGGMASSPLFTVPRKKEIRILLDHFKGVAEEIMAVDVAIHSRLNDFILQEEITGTIAESLVALAEKEVVKSQKIIENTHKLATRILLFVTFAGLITAILISRLMTINIIHRILQLTKSAQALKNGHLGVVDTQEGDDEIGELSRTFNFMAVRIRDFVENLENTVEERTVALAISEKRFYELFEHSSDGMAIYKAIDGGEDFIFKEMNHAMERIQGVQRHKVLGKKVTGIFSTMIESGMLDVFKAVWHTGKAAEHPITSYVDARLYAWHENKVYQLPGGDIAVVCSDKTLEKQAEEQKKVMEYQLRQARKMEAIGLLAGGVAHDLNNILAPIVGYPELFLPELPEQSPLREPLTAIHESGKRAGAIVADLLTVARGRANTRDNSNLNDLIKYQLDAAESRELLALYQGIECRTHLDPQLLNISCSPVHIQKCITNLLINAMEAMEAMEGMDGTDMVTLSTSNCGLDETQALGKGVIPGEYVVFRVTDSGPEISEKDMEHIFEPFYIKKVMGKKGTGLGLVVTWNIMQEHDGAVQVESGPEGTTFCLYLPATEKSVPRNEKRVAVVEDLMGHGEHILVVDDTQVRLLAKDILERFGYHGECVSSGEVALDYVKETPVDLVLLDMLMDPGINGRQTYEAILKIHPGQRAVVGSGFSESEDIEKTLQLGASGFIKKPYTIKALARIVKSTLSS